jgi:hypothetical protein
VKGKSDKLIWWTLEYGGEYEPDLNNWQGQIWACDPTWAQAHGAKLVVMGSHPDLPYAKPPTPEQISAAGFIPKLYDYVMLAYMTPRRDALKKQLADLSTPEEIYPGYDHARHIQLTRARLMLHAHQRDDTPAIAPQRFALCAAYSLPLIHEDVPDAGAYDEYADFIHYEKLAQATRLHLARAVDNEAMGEKLHDWLCVENTFRKSVEAALRD